MKIQFQYLHAALRNYPPGYATEGSAAIDLRSVEEDFELHPQHDAILVRTGLAIHIADPNYVGLIAPRSSAGHKYGVSLGNTLGVIDSDYQGEIMLSLWNHSPAYYASHEIKYMERIAQLLIVPVQQVELEEVTCFPISGRGTGGFGHTGKH